MEELRDPCHRVHSSSWTRERQPLSSWSGTLSPEPFFLDLPHLLSRDSTLCSREVDDEVGTERHTETSSTETRNRRGKHFARPFSNSTVPTEVERVVLRLLRRPSRPDGERCGMALHACCHNTGNTTWHLKWIKTKGSLCISFSLERVGRGWFYY